MTTITGSKQRQPRRETPRLTVVIPAYNVAPYVEDAVLSALDQSFRDLEVIVVDDGSTDATRDVLEALDAQRNDPRLRLIHQPNGGLSAARNTGVRHALGEYIGFLDSDDLWLPEKAACHIARLDNMPTLGISFSQSAYITEKGERTGGVLLTGKRRPSLHDMIRRNHVGNGSTPVIRRECFDKVGLFREDLKSCEDYEMWCRILALTGYHAFAELEPLTLYRLREASLSFDVRRFVANADLAIALMREAMPNVPGRVFRAGHAEHYRIAAWKAASVNQNAIARQLLLRATRMWPPLLVSDWRALGTAAALVMPMRLREPMVRTVKAMQQRFVSNAN